MLARLRRAWAALRAPPLGRFATLHFDHRSLAKDAADITFTPLRAMPVGTSIVIGSKQMVWDGQGWEQWPPYPTSVEAFMATKYRDPRETVRAGYEPKPGFVPVAGCPCKGCRDA